MSQLVNSVFNKVKETVHYSPSSTVPQVSIIMPVSRDDSYEAVSSAIECIEKSSLVLDYEIVFVVDRVAPEVEGLFLRLGSSRRLSIVRVDSSATVAERRLAGHYYSFASAPLILYTTTRIRYDLDNMETFQLLVDEILSRDSIWLTFPRGCEYDVQLYRRVAVEQRMYGWKAEGETLEAEIDGFRSWILKRGYLAFPVEALVKVEE